MKNFQGNWWPHHATKYHLMVLFSIAKTEGKLPKRMRKKSHLTRKLTNFDVLLTVHLSIFISVINLLDSQNFSFTISLFHASTCFEHHVLIIRRSKLYYTASGIITPIVLSQPVHETATSSYDDTRGCVMKFWPPDDEHMCSKHVEA